MPKNKKTIAVIGAGIAGLTCAYELQKKGYLVTVYEKENYVGGRMSTRTKDGFPMDTGANHLANVYTHMRELVDELGLEWNQMEFLNYKIIHRHHRDSLNMGHAMPLLSDISKKTKFKLALRALLDTRKKTDFFNLSTAVQYDNDTAANFAEHALTKEAHDYIVDPFVTTYQFHRANELSVAVGYAMIRSHYKHKSDWALQRIEGGMIALPQALADKLDVKLSTPIKNIASTDKGVVITTKKGKKTYDAAVLATTANITKKIFPTASSGQQAVLNGTKYATTVGVGFKIPKDTLGDTTIVWVPYVEGGTISGYTNEAMKGKSLIKNGKTLILTWFHEEFAKTIIDKTDKEIFEVTKKELLKVCPYINDESILEPHDLQRWPEAIPKYSQGHLTRVKTFQEHHQGENNIFFAGDYLNAPWTEGALQNGQRTANEVIQKLTNDD